jgi:hypothetical protein
MSLIYLARQTESNSEFKLDYIQSIYKVGTGDYLYQSPLDLCLDQLGPFQSLP